MTRLLLAGAVLVSALGLAIPASAQPYPPRPSEPMYYRVIRILPDTSDTRRDPVGVSPNCGAANPQGGVPSAVTWGDCP
jgi:hypothetical protein